MTLLFQKWRLSNLQEGIIVAQYLCSYKFPAILKWLSGESEFIDLKLQFSSYIIHRCDERGDVCSRYILCFPYLNIDWGWPGVGEDQGHSAGVHTMLFIVDIKTHLLRDHLIAGKFRIFKVESGLSSRDLSREVKLWTSFDVN